eukprot:4189429-Pyramimonas_sp.AAC.1
MRPAPESMRPVPENLRVGAMGLVTGTHVLEYPAHGNLMDLRSFHSVPTARRRTTTGRDGEQMLAIV